MDQSQTYAFFEKLVESVSQSIGPFVKENKLEKKTKKDETGCKTLVTNIDGYLGEKATELAKKYGLKIISEEGENEIGIVKGGTYLIVDPIDGTIAAAKHVETSKDKESPHINNKLGPEDNYTFLGAIIEEGKPKFGVCYDYVSGETIFLDSDNKNNLVWEKSSSDLYVAKNAHYVDNRFNKNPDETNKRLIKEADKTYWYSSPGKAFILAQLNNHDSVAIHHFWQQNGLWDIATACVIAENTKTKILDGNKNPINFKNYLLIPGQGNILYRGEKFSWLGKNL